MTWSRHHPPIDPRMRDAVAAAAVGGAPLCLLIVCICMCAIYSSVYLYISIVFMCLCVYLCVCVYQYLLHLQLHLILWLFSSSGCLTLESFHAAHTRLSTSPYPPFSFRSVLVPSFFPPLRLTFVTSSAKINRLEFASIFRYFT